MNRRLTFIRGRRIDEAPRRRVPGRKVKGDNGKMSGQVGVKTYQWELDTDGETHNETGRTYISVVMKIS